MQRWRGEGEERDAGGADQRTIQGNSFVMGRKIRGQAMDGLAAENYTCVDMPVGADSLEKIRGPVMAETGRSSRHGRPSGCKRLTGKPGYDGSRPQGRVARRLRARILLHAQAPSAPPVKPAPPAIATDIG